LEKITIAQGVTLNYIKTEKFKTNYLSFNFVCPLNAEKASLNALIPQVLIRGTEKYPSMALIKEKLDDLYAASVEGRVYRRGEYQVCGMTASWLNDRFAIDGTKVTEGTLDILEELIFYPQTEDGVFVAGYVEGEKNNLIDDIRAIINNKNGYAVKRCQQEMCKEEPFGISEYGEEDDVKKITPKKLFEAYKTLISTSRIEIFYVGSADVCVIEKRIASMFENCKRDYIDNGKTVVIKDVKEIRNITEPCTAVQGKLSLGFRTGCVLGEKEYKAFPLFIELYGGSPVSKLFMNVRERLSLCYYCRAIPEGIKGIMIVTAGIEVSNKEKTQKEILAQLDNVVRGDFSEEELELAKKSLKNGYNELSDSPASLEGWYLTRRLAGVDDTPEKVVEDFMSVTKDDIINVASKIKLDTVYFLEGVLKDGEIDETEESDDE